MPGFFQRSQDQRLMAKMDAIEVTHCNDARGGRQSRIIDLVVDLHNLILKTIYHNTQLRAAFERSNRIGENIWTARAPPWQAS